jgi:hypothetical protein
VRNPVGLQSHHTAGPMMLGGAVEPLVQTLREALGAGAEAVVWTECGDEVVVHAGDALIRRDGDALLAEIPLESDETGRHVLVVPLLEAGDTVLTSRRPWGDERLTTRWGEQLQNVVVRVLAGEIAR